jgi:hypothetical protein
LALETKSRIELQHLSPSTAQYVRCVKAVHDNLHNCFGFNKSSAMIPDPDNVQILNIFKLKNTVLARNLQVTPASRIPHHILSPTSIAHSLDRYL